MKLHTCMLCEAVCGVEVDQVGPSDVRVRGDAQDPFSRGHVCPKAAALPDVSFDPDRVREPLRRVGDRFEAVAWDEALADVGRRIADVQKRHGRNAVGVYLGNPTVHSHGAILAVPWMSRLLGTKSRFSATSLDQLPHMLASLQVLGSQLLLPVPDVDRTRFFLVLGANPMASNGSLMTLGRPKARLTAIRERGGRLVVVDPRRTETAALADEHLAIRPGTDALFLLAVLHVIFAEGRERPGRLAPLVRGMDELRRVAERFSPEELAEVTGIDASTTWRLARQLSDADGACVYGRVGVCTQAFGGLAAWLVLALNVVTGNLDRPGGAMFPKPAVDLVALGHALGQKGHFGVWRSRVRGLPEFGGELPAAVMAEEMTTEGKGQIKALITFAGNPVLSAPDGPALERALSGLELMVSVDLFVNETTRFAHYVLPTSFGLEREHHDLAFHAFAVRNGARWAEPVLTPPPGVRSDWDVLTDLALRVHGAGGGRRDRALALALRAARAVGPRRILDGLLRAGPYGTLRGGSMSLPYLQAHPHGVDLGPLTSRLPDILATDDGTLRLAPALFLGDIPRLEALLSQPRREGTLQLVGRRHIRSNNSWMHNAERLVKGPGRCTLMMHPADARARGLARGDRVRIGSASGSVEAPVEITDGMRPGVVSLPHGWGHGRAGTRLGVARDHAGVSLNDVTDAHLVDELSGTAVLNGVEVVVERVERVERSAGGADQVETAP